MLEFLSELYYAFVWDWNLRIFPLYLAGFLVLGWLYFKFVARKNTGFFAWLFPKEIYLNPSQLVDLKLFAVGRALNFLGVFGTVSGATAVAVATMSSISMLTGIPLGGENAVASQGVFATILIVVAADFSVYWIHRMHHEVDFLWPFHSVHHSAEVMSPITIYRKHPMYDLIAVILKSLVIGLVQGIILFFVFDGVDMITIGAANAIYFAFNMLGSNFRHTHIWIDYGRVIDHVLISPAQHQIHHSRAPEHIDKNHGEIFALWDWMFGTLYVPSEKEVLEFGIVDEFGNAIQQPHGTLKDALVEPFLSSQKALRARSALSKQAAARND